MEKQTKKIKRKFPRIYAFIVGASVVLFWRGIWQLADIYLLPNNETLSSLVGLVVGTVVLIVLHKFKDELV